VDDFVSLVSGDGGRALTDVSKSVMSHKMSYAAELSRLNGGKLIEL